MRECAGACVRKETGGGCEEVDVVERNACVSLEGRIGDLKCAGASDLGLGMGLMWGWGWGLQTFLPL